MTYPQRIYILYIGKSYLKTNFLGKSYHRVNSDELLRTIFSLGTKM